MSGAAKRHCDQCPTVLVHLQRRAVDAEPHEHDGGLRGGAGAGGCRRVLPGAAAAARRSAAPLKDKWNRSKLWLHSGFLDFLEDRGVERKIVAGRFRRKVKSSSRLEDLAAFAAGELEELVRKMVAREGAAFDAKNHPLLVQLRHTLSVGTVLRGMRGGADAREDGRWLHAERLLAPDEEVTEVYVGLRSHSNASIRRTMLEAALSHASQRLLFSL